jgi:hypothetical protein
VPRFGLTSMIAATASSGAPTPSFAPVVAVQARAPPPSDELAREALARRYDGGGLVGNGG